MYVVTSISATSYISGIRNAEIQKYVNHYSLTKESVLVSMTQLNQEFTFVWKTKASK